jgi:hypothetical protein
MSLRPPLAPLAVLCVAAASLLLTACGGSSPTNAASAERSREQQAETKFADFAKCMREHGINAEAATGPEGGHGLKISPGKAGGSPQALEAAQNACQRYRPAQGKPVNLSPQQKVEREEAVRKFAKCMREHGIEVEALTQGGAIRIGIHGGPGSGGPNPESPSFQAAQKACQSLLPFKGGPGPGRAPAGGAPALSTAHGAEGSSSDQAGG